MNSTIITTVEDHIKKEMEGLCSAHDYFHIERVVKLAKNLHTMEGEGDSEVIVIGALMHESLDDKFFSQDDMEGRKATIRKFLVGLDISSEKIEKVMFIIENVGYGKSLDRGENFEGSIEFKIVEDADRIEALGALGIARTFAFSGKKKQPIYDPAIKPKAEIGRKNYATGKNTAINHFYEKLLLLKDLMHTSSGKKLAQQRHEFMEDFLEQFYKERDVT